MKKLKQPLDCNEARKVLRKSSSYLAVVHSLLFPITLYTISFWLKSGLAYQVLAVLSVHILLRLALDPLAYSYFLERILQGVYGKQLDTHQINLDAFLNARGTSAYFPRLCKKLYTASAFISHFSRRSWQGLCNVVLFLPRAALRRKAPSGEAVLEAAMIRDRDTQAKEVCFPIGLCISTLAGFFVLCTLPWEKFQTLLPLRPLLGSATLTQIVLLGRSVLSFLLPSSITEEVKVKPYKALHHDGSGFSGKDRESYYTFLEESNAQPKKYEALSYCFNVLTLTAWVLGFFSPVICVYTASLLFLAGSMSLVASTYCHYYYQFFHPLQHYLAFKWAQQQGEGSEQTANEGEPFRETVEKYRQEKVSSPPEACEPTSESAQNSKPPKSNFKKGGE